MQLRGTLSDKQKLVMALEKAYLKANSEKDFFQRLKQQGFEFYCRGGKEAGVILKRKFRFKTLGYDREVLRGLNKNLSKDRRLNTLSKIRQKQQERKHSRER